MTLKGYTSGGAIHVTLGDGACLGIDDKDQLFILDRNGTRIDLNRATVTRFTQLQECLGRLIIHALPE
ncbi:hypothetical protein [Mesorhizobium sp. M4B.F.Ca.ET.058.02.1.1]|uniref:hypothetical protein n=1 Tax=Mesorhizobium sp. M4B.F.Ca.ET.058.02.1.1 TaxID=2493675 RepID=UPI000F756AA4|nr:hypothetical protein [Mesorhizobium sp. M4B.F.Ca.ET.058.02.1.1]AZO48080.1 hypothetical protein EJ073_09815 [Mesorhizobium sp. M4B.F.Ca.ET.058.02.1.1]